MLAWEGGVPHLGARVVWIGWWPRGSLLRFGTQIFESMSRRALDLVGHRRRRDGRGDDLEPLRLLRFPLQKVNF